MSEQRFDIVVSDKVAPSIKEELARIGESARSATSDLQKLNAEMARNTSSAATAAQTAATRTAAATARMNAENAKAAIQTARLDAAQLKSALSAEKLALAQAKTAEAQSKANLAYLKEEEALNRAVAAEQRAISSKNQLASASARAAQAQQTPAALAAAGLGPSLVQAPAGGGAKAALTETGQLAGAQAAANALAAERSIKGVETAAEELSVKGPSFFTKFTSASGAAFNTVKSVAGATAASFFTSSSLMGRGAVTAGEGMEKLASKAHLGAGGLRELLVLVREGSRGDFTRMAGSASLLASYMGVLGTVLPIAAVGFGVLYAAHKSFNDDVAKSQLKEYASTLGLTTKEMRKLSDTHLDAKGNLHELNLEQVTYGDTIRGLWKTLTDNQGVNTFWQTFKERAETAFDTIMGRLREMYAMLSGVRAALAAAEEGLNVKTVAGDIAAGKNPFTGLGDKIADEYNKGKAAALKALDDTAKTARANAIQAAKDRLKAEADAIKENRNVPKGPKPWNRAQNLQNDNGELDAQIKNLGLYGDELERANQLEQISKKYRDHNVPLTAQETAALAAKIKVEQDGKRVQEAMTAADEAANGPARKYNDTIDGLNTLLEKGALTQEQYADQMRLATRAYQDATDPLAALNRELQKNGQLMGLYGKDKDVAAYIQNLQTAAEAKGQSIYKPGTVANDNGTTVVTGNHRTLTDQAQGMVDDFKNQQDQTAASSYFQRVDSKQKYQDPNDNSYVIQHHKELYAEIQRLRDQDVIGEGDAAQRKKDLDRDYLDARLSTTSSMLGQLSQLQNSKNKEVAALGKAAAIGQATIDGYRAVQAALVGPPGPPWSFAIAGVTAAMTAANVAKIAGIGFMSGGYTGNGPTNQVAGAVHGREFVFDAAATQRLGVPALEALRNGSTLSQPANNNSPMGRSKVSVYPATGIYTEVRERSDGEIEVIAERAARRVAPGAVAADIHSSPNSKTSTALKQNYGLARNR